MLSRIVNKIKQDEFSGLMKSLFRRVKPYRLASLSKYKSLFKDKVGFEIGGPSPIFQSRGAFPVYSFCEKMDNCNFSHETTWEGSITEGHSFLFSKSKEPGKQFVGEATNLEFLSNESYDFFLSSHALEHIANPMKALFEWKRILKKNGVLALVVPHHVGTFDHKRSITAFEHVIQDFDNDTTEADLTHMEEILEFHDYTMTPEITDIKSFRQRCENNFTNRCLHHHVFDTELTVKMIDFLGLEIKFIDVFEPHNILIVARKLPDFEKPVNERFLSINYDKKTDIFVSYSLDS